MKEVPGPTNRTKGEAECQTPEKNTTGGSSQTETKRNFPVNAAEEAENSRENIRSWRTPERDKWDAIGGKREPIPRGIRD